MRKLNYLFFTLLILLGLTSYGFAQTHYEEGLQSAAKSYGLGQLVKEAKRRDPNSPLPWMIEHMLAGLYMANDPTVTMEAVFPGSLAANAIGQLIERHGKDIANMTFRERKVFIGNEYGDPSLIPDTTYTRESDPADAVCRKMFDVDYGGVADCKMYVAKIQQCNSSKKPSNTEIKHCTSYLSEFYDHMEYLGKTKLVKQAGKIATNELKTILTGGGVEGIWNTTHIHEGCSSPKSFCDKYLVPLHFSKNKAGEIIATWPGYSLRGVLDNTIYIYDIYNGDKHHGKGSFKFDIGYRSFKGKWNDKYGHKGTWTGRR